MTPSRRQFLAIATVTAGAAALPGRASAAPKSRLIDDRWTTHGSGGDPDHAAWGGILSKHLRTGTASGVALFDYGAARNDRAALQGYIEAMQGVQPTTLSSGAAFAYWVNLYNAVTVDLVLGAYPVESIREVNGGLFNTGPWTDDVVNVDGQDLSLDDIEHGILRPVWRDPRIHYAVNCASIGCPDLAAKPYTAASLESMLEAGARSYVAHSRGASVRGGGIVASSIYEWFEEDFGGNEAGVIAHLKAYAPKAKAADIGAAGGIDDYEYDWSLNDAGAAG
ncbi:MAG: DUF547 domain-containing protein [Pseudomonadota bacterium]